MFYTINFSPNKAYIVNKLILYLNLTTKTNLIITIISNLNFLNIY